MRQTLQPVSIRGTRFGAIAGALIAGFILIPLLRYEGAIKLAVCINASLALIVALVVPTRHIRLAVASVVALVLIVVAFQPATPESLLRVSPLNDTRGGDIRYYDVGRSSTVLLLERDGYFYLRTNGLPEASTDRRRCTSVAQFAAITGRSASHRTARC